MRKLLSLIMLSCVMAIGAGVSVSSANAAQLTSVVHSLKVEQTNVVEKAYYHRGYHRGYLSWLLSSPLLWWLLSPRLLWLRPLSSPLLVA